MGAFFDSRKFLRTPGFAQEGLYDDPDQGLPPLPDRIARPDDQPSPMGLSGMLAAAPSEPSQMREMPQQQPSQSMSRPLPPRERITLPDAPLPPKVGKMRQILGTAAELYLPQVGQEIRQPGYDRAQKEYGNKVAKLQMEAKLNEAAAQEDFHVANSRAAMARAEASNAQRDRTRAQMSTDGGFDLAPGHVRFGRNGGTPIANNPLPPKPGDAGVKIGRDGRPYFEEGEKFTTLPPAVASTVITSSKPQGKPQSILQYEAIARGKNPNISDAGLAMEVAVMAAADREAGLARTKAQTNRANRPPASASSGDDSPMSPEAVEMAAKMYLKTGQLPAIGGGSAAGANRRSIMNRAGVIDSGADIAGNKAGYGADKSSLQSLQKTQDAISAFENTTLKNLDTFLETSKGVVDTGSPLFNKPMRAITEALGSTNTTKFNTARQVAVTEAAKVLNNPTSNAALSDSARGELQKIMDPNASLAQIHAAAAILKQDMHNRKASGESQLRSIRERIGGGHAQVTPPAAPTGSSVRMQKTDASGKTVTRDIFPDKVEAAKAAGYRMVQ